jgi:hypothetical protein
VRLAVRQGRDETDTERTIEFTNRRLAIFFVDTGTTARMLLAFDQPRGSIGAWPCSARFHSGTPTTESTQSRPRCWSQR